MSYLIRVWIEVYEYHQKWMKHYKAHPHWSVHLTMINNYPIHRLLPIPVWAFIKKVICFVGPQCEICMAARWLIIGLLIGGLL